MKKYFLIIAAAASIFSSTVFADEYVDMTEYKPGSSLGWFYKLKAESQKKAKVSEIESNILNKLSEMSVSDEAFFYICDISKPIASEDSIEIISKALRNEKRSASACDVLLGIDSSDVDEALEEALNQESITNRMNIISTLAARNNPDNVEIIAKQANSGNPVLGKFATVALGRTLSSEAIDILNKIVEQNDGRRNSAIAALNALAEKAFLAGKPSLAKKALQGVPENYSPSIMVRGELSDNRVAYFDNIIAAGGFNSAMAGRAMNKGRTFENSQELIKKFPSLNRKAKLAAIGSFMITGDTRFYPTIAPEMDSPDADIKAEAIYSARFLCTDEPNLKKILEIFRKGERPYSNLARNVLVENPSFNLKKILEAEAAKNDLQVLEILVNRGDLKARNQLWKIFFDGNSKAKKHIEDSITYGDLKDFASNFKTIKDSQMREEIAKIIIKKLAKSREKPFMAAAAWEILDGNLDKSDSLYKFIGDKLKVKIAPPKKVWQEKYKARAVDDREMKVAKDAEPQIDGTFAPLFDGKTLNGWHTTTGSAKYSVVDGCILGETDPKMKQNSFLATDKKDYFNFIFVCDFKWVEHGNSGVIFRGQTNDKGGVYGPQAEMDDSVRAWSAGIYNEGFEWKYSLSREDQEAARKAVKLDDWNRMTILCNGDTIKTWLNGVPVSDLEWKGTKPGFFGLQIHAGMKCKVLWKNIKVKELK